MKFGEEEARRGEDTRGDLKWMSNTEARQRRWRRGPTSQARPTALSAILALSQTL